MKTSKQPLNRPKKAGKRRNPIYPYPHPLAGISLAIDQAIPSEEVQALIKATRENRLRLQKTWQQIKDLQVTIHARQNARMAKQVRRPVNTPKRSK